MKKKIIFLAVAIMLLPLFAGYCQVEEPEIVWEQYVGHAISEAQFSPDGSMIAYRNPDNGQFDIRDAENGEIIIDDIIFNGGGVRDFAFFPDSKRIAITTGVDGPVVYIFDIELGIVDSVRKYYGNPFDSSGVTTYVDVSPDGKYLVFGISIGWQNPELFIHKLLIMNFESKEIIDSLPSRDIEFSKDGKYLTTFPPNNTDNTDIKIYSVPDFKIFNTFSQGEESIWDISISPDGRMLATAGGSGYIRIWDIESGEMIFKELNGEVDRPVHAVNFSKESKYILTSRGNIKIREINSSDLKRIYDNYWFNSNGSCISPINNYLLAQKGYNNTLYLLKETWDFTTAYENPLIEHNTLYPNPTNEKVNIKLTLTDFSHVNIHITNIEGDLLETIFKGNLNPGEHQFYWDSSNYPSGNYYCRIETENYIKTYKIIVNK